MQGVGQKSRPQNEEEIINPRIWEAHQGQTSILNRTVKERENDESEQQTQKQTSQKQRCFIF